MLIIPDISFYQDNNQTLRKVDFVQMKGVGVGGVIIRGGQNKWIDPDFKDYWRAAREAGLWRGTYWLYDSRVPPQGQADLWRSAIENDLPELGAWMDFEENYGGPYWAEPQMREFAERVLFAFPVSVEVGVYTAPSWWNSRVGNKTYWAQFPLWIANYGVMSPTIPLPWTRWLFWQFTSKGDGLKYGVESLNIDLNNYNGNAAGLAVYFGINEEVPQPGGSMNIYEVVATALKIRYAQPAADGTLGADAGKQMPRGDTFYSDKIGSLGWLRIVKWVKYDGTEVYPPVGKEWWCSGSTLYVKLISSTTPPPPPPPPVPVTLKGANMNLDPVTGKVKTTYTYSDGSTKVLDS